MAPSLKNERNSKGMMRKRDRVNKGSGENGNRKKYKTVPYSQHLNTDKKYAPYSLPREMVPKIMWEPGILTGYRSMNKPWIFYFRSLFWIHNDTGNVWTHGLAPLFTVAMLYKFANYVDFYNNLSAQGLLVFTVGSGVLFVFSSMAHLLHSKSETAHYLTFCFDYMGLALYGYGQSMLNF